MYKFNFWGMTIALIMVSGCGNSAALIKASSASTRSGVFQETLKRESIPVGFADMTIYASIKTHKPSVFSGKDVHGTPSYQLLINIDGQPGILQAALSEENMDSRRLMDEAGDGIRYRFKMSIRLEAGSHRMVVASPSDGFAVVHQIVLPEGISTDLVLEPIYGKVPGKQRPGFYGVGSFQEGLKGFKVILNGKPLE